MILMLYMMCIFNNKKMKQFLNPWILPGQYFSLSFLMG